MSDVNTAISDEMSTAILEYDLESLGDVTAASSASEFPVEELDLFIASVDEPLRHFHIGWDNENVQLLDLDLVTAKSDLISTITAEDYKSDVELDNFINTAVSDVDTAKFDESLNEFLLTAASDVETATAVESLDQFVQTANSEVETAEELNLNDFVLTADSDVLTGLLDREDLDEFLNTATSEADTGVYGEVSDYEDLNEELDVEMNSSLYPQAYIQTLKLPNELRDCYTPKPKDLSFDDFL
ncbi:hypothetical protein M3Y96_00270700 [Aphelenchoides besseyi]|nr:hypothetical protein M3Y96_00270700 [Aphelenchoides besseyi]